MTASPAVTGLTDDRAFGAGAQALDLDRSLETRPATSSDSSQDSSPSTREAGGMTVVTSPRSTSVKRRAGISGSRERGAVTEWS